MMGVSLFGTCTMKYNPRVNEAVVKQYVSELHPHQSEKTLQGILEIVCLLEEALCELSGMDRFVFQPGGGADAAYLHACITRAYHASRGELAQRTEIITSIQAHPCNAATAATAGFDVVTLPLEENGYPSLAALEAVVSERTASLVINNPDDMGIYNPDIARWVEVVHEAGGLCFYDHANFNGVMGKIRAAELGFDACMFMLHKTFGAPKAGGGPAVGAYGCTEALAPFLPGPIVSFDGARYRLTEAEAPSVGRVREFLGNVPELVKAYAWVRAMGGDGIDRASDLSVLANNYMEKKLLEVRGVSKSHPHLTQKRLEMTRYSLEELARDTGVTAVDVQNRMVDFGVDAFWLSHEPWLVPEPFTPEAGEMWSKEDIDYWIAVLAHVCEEAYSDPEIVKRAPHRQVVHQLDPTGLDDPDRWATTWRAYRRKQAAATGG
jgi:glycine dehydrogenase subunit 2